MVWLSGLLPYEQAAEVLEKMGHFSVPVTRIWRETRAYGEQLNAHVRQEQGSVSIERTQLPPAGLDHRRRKGISMDSGMINIRNEGWKEVRVGAVLDVGQRLGHDAVTGETVEQACGTNVAYTAVVGSVDAFAPATWALATHHQLPKPQIPAWWLMGHPAQELPPHGKHDRFDPARVHYGNWGTHEPK